MPREVCVAGCPHGSYGLEPLFNRLLFICKFLINQHIPYFTQQHFTVLQGNCLGYFQFKG